LSNENRVTDANHLPSVIQGGMGVAVSGWRLAQAVGRTGQMGVVSGTALDTVLARRLQLGDPTGAIRRALAAHPWPAMAERVLCRWWRPEGLADSQAFGLAPMPTVPLSAEHTELLLTAAFCEVALAREGHSSPIGINLLEKIQLPTLPVLLGAMLAGVTAVLMGGGIPLAIPGVLDRLAQGEATELRIDIADARPDQAVYQRLDPRAVVEGNLPALQRPLFLGIVSTDVVAKALLRRASGRVDGFVVEHHRAGGHNAPPRRSSPASGSGEPAYGPRDEPDFEAVQALGLPFWLAGGRSTPEALHRAFSLGASGVQAGTAFAACRESGFAPDVKAALTAHALSGDLRVITDFRASPTGYPFKISNLPEAPASCAAGQGRRRICDLGYLRTVYLRADGSPAYRCPAGPVETFLAAGGLPQEIPGRCCLCNGLLAAIGMGQNRGSSGSEPPIVTLGDDWAALRTLALRYGPDYTASDVVRYLLGA
jgi:nitronate monooxygenase